MYHCLNALQGDFTVTGEFTEQTVNHHILGRWARNVNCVLPQEMGFLWLNGLLIFHFCYYLNWKTAIRRDEGSFHDQDQNGVQTSPPSQCQGIHISKPVFKIAILEWLYSCTWHCIYDSDDNFYSIQEGANFINVYVVHYK
ncbi:unnamed protein product [Sphagnum compactum]